MHECDFRLIQGFNNKEISCRINLLWMTHLYEENEGDNYDTKKSRKNLFGVGPWIITIII